MQKSSQHADWWKAFMSRGWRSITGSLTVLILPVLSLEEIKLLGCSSCVISSPVVTSEKPLLGLPATRTRIQSFPNFVEVVTNFMVNLIVRMMEYLISGDRIESLGPN